MMRNSSGAISIKPNIRQITFFNSKQALKEKADEQSAERSVFKLSSSVERMTTLQPNMSFQSISGQGEMTMQKYKRDGSTKQLFDSSLLIPDSTNRFQTINHQSSISSKMDKIHKRQASQCFENNPVRSNKLGGIRSPERSIKIKQSCLYHASKVTNESVQQMSTYKQQMRNYLAQSMTQGEMKIQPVTSFNNQNINGSAVANNTYNDYHEAKQTNLIDTNKKQMIN